MIFILRFILLISALILFTGCSVSINDDHTESSEKNIQVKNENILEPNVTTEAAREKDFYFGDLKVKVDRLAKIEVETTEEIEDDYEKRILIVTLIHEGETDYEISPQDFILASDEGNAYKQLTVSEGFGKEYLYSMLDNSKARIPDSRNTDEILQFGNVYAVPKDDKDYLFTMKTDEFETGEYWIKLHKSSNDEFILYELK